MAPISDSSTFKRWQFWIDRGGTFTDVIGRKPDGSLVTAKLLSENPEHYPDAATEGIRRLLGLTPGQPVPAGLIDAVQMATTVSTNAPPEPQGGPLVRVGPRGFCHFSRNGLPTQPRSVGWGGGLFGGTSATFH